MMLRPTLISLAAFALLQAPAIAEPEHALELGQQARDILIKVEAAKLAADQAAILSAPDFPTDLKRSLQRFGLGAARLSSEMKSQGAPKDFQCIFRGMAEETGVQLKAIAKAESGYEQSDALARLYSMLEDADAVSEAASLTLTKSGPVALPIKAKTIGSCQRDSG